MNNLEPILRPRSVAVIGASHDPSKRGFQAVRALLDAGYAGRIVPVNPRGGELLGLPVATSIEPVDLALICTPAATVPGVMRELARAGVRGAVVLALGVDEEALRGAIAGSGLRVIGPNTSGILNLSMGLNLIGARGLRAGSIALLVQSGNLALSLLNQASDPLHEGISICIGAGNQTDLTLADYLPFLDRDEHTRVIALYVESLRAGRSFFEAARACRKPIVLLKGGRTPAGDAAARSHTGQLAGAYAVARAAFRQAGVIEVKRSDELFPVAETLAWQPAARGGIAVLSDGGGHATLAADALTELGAHLAVIEPETAARLRDLLGPNASTANPVDLANAPDAAPRIFADALRVLLDDPAVGGVLIAGLFGGYAIRFDPALLAEEEETARQISALAVAADKPVVVHSLFAANRTGPLQTLRSSWIPVHGSLEIACRCIAATAEAGNRARD